MRSVRDSARDSLRDCDRELSDPISDGRELTVVVLCLPFREGM